MAVAASVLMLHSCSNDEAFVTEISQETVAPEYIPGDSEVEIKLSSTNVAVVEPSTRAAIIDDGDIESLGIFCLAKDKQSGKNQQAPEINWFNEVNNWSSCIMDNVEADKIGQDIAWKNGGSYYYPISQFYTYDFYGYYPYSENLEYVDNRVSANYVLDGKTDLIWGRATSEEEGAYSAAYFRNPANVDKYPSLALDHLLTRLEFYITPGPLLEGGTDVAAAAKMAVKSITVKNVYTEVKMLIADYNNLDAPIAERLEANTEVVGSLSLCDETGVPFEPTQVPATFGATLKVGESLMLYPQSIYEVEIELVNTETNEEFLTEVPLQVTNNGTFVAGTSYKVNITVHSPREVVLRASLTPWLPAGDEDNPNIEL